MGDSDSVFLKRFSMVIAVLVVITIIIIVIAVNTVDDPSEDNNPSRIALANDRTLPVGHVRTEVSAADLAAAAPVSMTAVDPANIDGEAVYNSVCMACHVTGAAGAPIPGSDLWAERSAKGLEDLAYNAINGINTMPAKGGRMDLSDAEVTAAVEHMLAQ